MGLVEADLNVTMSFRNINKYAYAEHIQNISVSVFAVFCIFGASEADRGREREREREKASEKKREREKARARKN